MIRATFAVLVLSLFLPLCHAGDIPSVPGPVEISQALARGKSLRSQTALLPTALVKAGVLLKAGGVRYGHALVRVEDAHGEGGAVYKLFESIKTCMPKGVDQEVIEYTGTFFLDADLTMRSGSQITTSTVTFDKFQDKKPAEPGKAPEKEVIKISEKETVTADIQVKDDSVIWVRKEKRGDDPETISKGDPIKLHGVKPVPRNALIALAAFAKAEPGFKAGISSPFCVPSLDTGGMIDEFLIQPAWLETDLARSANMPEAKLILRERFFEGELNDKGLTVEPPAVEMWSDVLIWAFSDNFKVVSLPPAPPDSHVETEVADPDTLDTNAPLDFAKIKAALRVINEKMAKESARTALDDDLRARKEKEQPKK